MTMRVAAILDGTGQSRHLEISTPGGVYRGFAAMLASEDRQSWVRYYANGARRRFVRLEGSGTAERSTWRVVAPERTRQSRLVSERLGTDRWRRVMSIDEGGGWRVLWTDDLRRQ